jgi:hypothetical protein
MRIAWNRKFFVQSKTINKSLASRHKTKVYTRASTVVLPTYLERHAILDSFEAPCKF